MPTSTTAVEPRHAWPDTRKHRRAAGFTLLEISLVLLLLSVVLVVVVPRFRDRGRAELLSHAHRLQLTFRLLRNEAVLNGAAYRLYFDLDQQRYWVVPEEAGTVDLRQFAADLGALGRGVALGDSVRLMDVALPLEGVKAAQGGLYTVFYPDGSVDPTIVHLATSREAYTLWFDPRSQKLQGREGYWEPTYAQ